MRLMRFQWLALGVLAVIGSGIARAEDVRNIKRDQWLGILSTKGSETVGYVHITIDRVKFGGEDVYRERKSVKYRDCLGGPKFKWGSEYTLYVDDNFNPVFESYAETCRQYAKTHTRTVEASYGAKSIDCKVNTDNNVTYKSITIPPGTDFANSCRYCFDPTFFSSQPSTDLMFFNPVTLSICHNKLTARKTDPYTIWETKYEDVIHFELEEFVSCWQKDGDELAVTIPYSKFGVYCLKPEWVEGIRNNVLTDSYATEINREMPNEPLMEMNVRFSDAKLATTPEDDARQSFKLGSDGKTAEFTVKVKDFDPSTSIVRPVTNPAYAEWLRELDGIEVNSPEIQSLAKEIVGDETNAYKAATNIRKWINSNITYEEISENSALATLKAKKGVCRHKALLFAAIARSAGIPTRVVAGCRIDKGYFWGHAWVECYVGEWVPLDPTISNNLVDASHVRLYRGGKDCFAMIHKISSAQIDSFKAGSWEQSLSDSTEYTKEAGKSVHVRTSKVTIKYLDGTKEPCPKHSKIHVLAGKLIIKDTSGKVIRELPGFVAGILPSGDVELRQVYKPSGNYPPGDQMIPGGPNDGLPYEGEI